jgi:two-component system, sensor histidine kinase and response regulator
MEKEINNQQEKSVEDINNSGEILQRIINLLPIRVFWKDKDLKYLGCNEIFARDAGKNKPEELIGKDDFAMGWHDQADAYRADDQKVIASGKAKLNFEEPQTTPQGTTIWIKTSKIPLVDAKGNTVGVLGTYEDITERKEAEGKLKQKNEELQEMNKLMVGRELKMVELKNEIATLKEQLQHFQPTGKNTS